MNLAARIIRLETRRRQTALSALTDEELDRRIAELRSQMNAAGEGNAFEDQLRAMGMTDADLAAIDQLAAAL